MPKLNSQQIKNKRKMLDWAGNNFHKLKEVNKVKIWIALLSKELPDKHEGQVNGTINVIFEKDTSENHLQAPRFAVPSIQ